MGKPKCSDLNIHEEKNNPGIGRIEDQITIKFLNPEHKTEQSSVINRLQCNARLSFIQTITENCRKVDNIN